MHAENLTYYLSLALYLFMLVTLIGSIGLYATYKIRSKSPSALRTWRSLGTPSPMTAGRSLAEALHVPLKGPGFFARGSSSNTPSRKRFRFGPPVTLTPLNGVKG